MEEPDFSPAEFGRAFQRFLNWADRSSEADSSPFAAMLRTHFGADPSEYPVTAQAIAMHDLPNLQLGLDALLERPEVQFRLVGFSGPVAHVDLSLSGLIHDEEFGIAVGPVRRRSVELDGGRRMPCVTTGLYLITTDAGPIALLVSLNEEGFGSGGLRLEILAAEDAQSDALAQDLRDRMLEHNVYRGKVLALGGSGDYGDQDMAIRFREVPPVGREDIVLPDGVLDIVELHTVDFATHAERLLAGGRHLRRGVLLHGPPGTGKTLTVEYLIRRLEGRTTLVLSGSVLSLIEEACSLARDLVPSMVVLEDIDLVAQDRMMDGASSLLFELMNQIDGIGGDADVIFLMTTNRADVLEPALASRPGRVDQAVEIPLPDADARLALLNLYLGGLDAALQDPAPVIDATEGASAAFIRELVRKAALVAARDQVQTVDDRHFEAALSLLEQGGQLTRSMLGGDADKALDAVDDDDWDDRGGAEVRIF